MPILAACYTFSFAKDHLIRAYADMKRSRSEESVADVHALAAGLKVGGRRGEGARAIHMINA